MQVPREPEVVGDDAQRLTDRWTTLPIRVRRAVVAGLSLLLVGLGMYEMCRPDGPKPQAAPTAHPLRPVATRLDVEDVVGPDLGRRSLKVRLKAVATTKTVITDVKPSEAGIRVSVRPKLPLRLPSGKRTGFTLTLEVRRCASGAVAARPFRLAVTVRSAWAIQVRSPIPSGRIASELDTALRVLCRPSSTSASRQ
ncbi:hypothetical protein G5C51_26230 [Streptomyces sp. A7024]|uniref:Tat pathway signal sequence domain protein n=1 Tax=Streptomyces coryli TaxID=1128680 RepID=A0A6G4U6N0_9ACTN|nr:hypothetical protein [Streptomyces coryli]NGN67390.1 hypothetical protein [Streptomyces coryli]